MYERNNASGLYFSDFNQIDLRVKKKRNFDLLIQSMQEDQENARLWMYLGREMIGLDNDKAIRYLNITETKAKSPEMLDWIRKSKLEMG